jgi:hypothetical protein
MLPTPERPAFTPRAVPHEAPRDRRRRVAATTPPARPGRACCPTFAAFSISPASRPVHRPPRVTRGPADVRALGQDERLEALRPGGCARWCSRSRGRPKRPHLDAREPVAAVRYGDGRCDPACSLVAQLGCEAPCRGRILERADLDPVSLPCGGCGLDEDDFDDAERTWTACLGAGGFAMGAGAGRAASAFARGTERSPGPASASLATVARSGRRRRRVAAGGGATVTSGPDGSAGGRREDCRPASCRAAAAVRSPTSPAQGCSLRGGTAGPRRRSRDPTTPSTMRKHVAEKIERDSSISVRPRCFVAVVVLRGHVDSFS